MTICNTCQIATFKRSRANRDKPKRRPLWHRPILIKWLASLFGRHGSGQRLRSQQWRVIAHRGAKLRASSLDSLARSHAQTLGLEMSEFAGLTIVTLASESKRRGHDHTPRQCCQRRPCKVRLRAVSCLCASWFDAGTKERSVARLQTIESANSARKCVGRRNRSATGPSCPIGKLPVPVGGANEACPM